MSPKPRTQDDYAGLWKRFYNFHDGIIRAISVQYPENGTRHMEIHVSTRDSIAHTNDGWVNVRIIIRNVSELSVRETPRTSIQILSQGIHTLCINNHVAIEFGGIIDCPHSLESLRSSDGYAIGQEVELQVEPYTDSP